MQTTIKTPSRNDLYKTITASLNHGTIKENLVEEALAFAGALLVAGLYSEASEEDITTADRLTD